VQDEVLFWKARRWKLVDCVFIASPVLRRTSTLAEFPQAMPEVLKEVNTAIPGVARGCINEREDVKQVLNVCTLRLIHRASSGPGSVGSTKANN
jgi:hypothetical protein